MNRTRRNRIYSYYFMSARNMYDELCRIKATFLDGEISYKKAWKRMDALVRMIQQRCELCFNLVDIRKEQTTAYDVLKNTNEIVAWMVE